MILLKYHLSVPHHGMAVKSDLWLKPCEKRTIGLKSDRLLKWRGLRRVPFCQVLSRVVALLDIAMNGRYSEVTTPLKWRGLPRVPFHHRRASGPPGRNVECLRLRPLDVLPRTWYH
jgi:hypothetical protein